VLQQRDASTFGFWVFLATEVMFFGGLFLAYIVYRNAYPVAFAESSRKLDIFWGTVNTAVLLFSSFTMAMAVQSAQLGKKWRLLTFLFVTMVLGSVFLVIKFSEYVEKFHEHLVPGAGFAFSGSDAVHAQVFFFLYFVMTGLHALHMLVGLVLLLILMAMTLVDDFSQEYYTPVETIGLYWHFVDVIWVFLFPILYLVDRSG
jgi:cytochrome c oxidase subunit 3